MQTRTPPSAHTSSTMHTRRAARVAAEEADAALESASAREQVLFSEDLWTQQLWRWLDPDAKAALRAVSKGMRIQVDWAVEVLASRSSGASANELRSALLRWPAVRELTLLNVSDATALAPLSTASLAGLTFRQKVGTAMRMEAHPMHGRMARTPSLTPASSHASDAWLHAWHAWLARRAHAAVRSGEITCVTAISSLRVCRSLLYARFGNCLHPAAATT
jgi:hypothetical protein